MTLEPSIGCRICLTQFGAKDTPEIRAKIVGHIKQDHRDQLIRDLSARRGGQGKHGTPSLAEANQFVEANAPQYVMVGPYTTRWTAECGCQVEYEWNPFSNENERIHLPVRSLNICQIHADVKDPQDQYAKLLEACKRKANLP